MIRLRRSTIVEAPAELVWRVLRDFNSHDSWHPAVAESRIENSPPHDAPGAVRAFRLTDGAFLREQLIALSDRDMSLTYCILEAPLPLMGYVATLRLRPVTDGDRTFIQWESQFDPPPGQAEALSRLVAEDIYEAGLAALQARFDRRRRTPGSGVDVPALPRPAVQVDREARIGERSGGGAHPAAMETEAIVVEHHGGPEVLARRKILVPPPGAGEVRLRHDAIGVNFIDVHCRTGESDLLRPPAVPGMEAAGIVLDAGTGVTHLAAGDRVVYACPPVGAYAAARTMEAELLVRLPADIGAETAAAIFLKGLLADVLLNQVHRIGPGESILVHAAAGGVGLILCRWAKALGANVIGTVSTEVKADAALRAGCDHVIVRRRHDFTAVVCDLTRGRGVDVVYDAFGRETFDGSLAALGFGGQLVSYGQTSGPVGERDIGALAAKSVTLSRPNFGHYSDTAEKLRPMADRLFEAIRTGAVAPTIDTRLPLAEAAEGHRRLEARENIGALILIP
jgi:NADPH:quinone reductase-like Zn-dependent oxidoreductase